MKALRRRTARLRRYRATWIPVRVGFDTADGTGQGLVEYGLIITLIAIVTIIALIFLGGQLSAILSIIGSSIDSST